ncbi:MAG: ABC transporter permease [Saprospiraceae bacterium]|nr:ABC transporter permease [Saprospiraceae bacterium]
MKEEQNHVNPIFDFVTRWLPISVLAIFFVAALFADFLANDKPIYAKVGDNTYWPVWESIIGEENDMSINWRITDPDFAIYPIFPFSDHSSPNLSIRYKGPGTTSERNGRRFTHWLGTDRLGRDVAANMIYGCRKSLFVGFLAMILAAVIGITLGIVAGYWGDHKRYIHPMMAILILFLTAYALFLLINGLAYGLPLLLLFLVLFALLQFTSSDHRGRWPLLLDSVTLRLIEVFNSVPGLLLLLVVGSMFSRPSLVGVAVLIGVLRWTRFARFCRGEVLKAKEGEFITAAQVAGQSDASVIWRYLLPEIVGPLVVVFVFGVASAIILESTLSFLGIGVPVEQITWGSLLGQAKYNLNAWWLAVFPGLAIFLLIVSLNYFGDQMRGKAG